MTLAKAKRGLAAAVLACGLGGSALAQTTPVQPQPRDPNMPAPQNTLPEKIESDSTAATGAGDLSKKLERSEGVIKPPASGDAGMVKPAPDAGRTPVIRPPGEPGGDQSIQPK